MNAAKRLVKYVLGKSGYRITRLNNGPKLEGNTLFEAVLKQRLRQSPDFFFVEIGANDGVFCDPIFDFVTRNHARGIVVEPLKDLFRKLVHNYKDHPGVVPVNAAIHATEKSMTMYRVDPVRGADLPPWVKGMGSFRKEHLTESQVVNIPTECLLIEEVVCVTLREILEKYRVAKVDLLQVDTEGYDYEIIKMIDFVRYKPNIIHFEHGLTHEIMGWDRFIECLQLLYKQEYTVIVESNDAIAYLA